MRFFNQYYRLYKIQTKAVSLDKQLSQNQARQQFDPSNIESTKQSLSDFDLTVQKQVMIKDGSSFDRRASPNTNVTEQLYEQFIVLKDYLDTSKKKKHQKNQQQDQSQQNHNKSKEHLNTKKQQSYLKQHRNQHNMIINTPKPTRKWLKFINKNESNNSHDQSQQQIYTNSPQQASEYKNQLSQNFISNQQFHKKSNQNKSFNPNLNFDMNQSIKRSQLIDEYTQLYEYSIKKVIENNNRRIKKKRKRNQDSQQQHNIKHIASNLQHQFNKIDKNNILNIEDNNRLQISENTVQPRENSQIARKLIFNHQDTHQNDNQQLIQQNATQQTNIFVQNLLVPFQVSISKMINSHSQRLKQIDQNLCKIKLFMHDNYEKQANSKIHTEYQTQQKQQKVSKWKENSKQYESQQNQINKQKQNMQALQFNEFDEEYVPDETSSIYSQTISGRDLQFDQQT